MKMKREGKFILKSLLPLLVLAAGLVAILGSGSGGGGGGTWIPSVHYFAGYDTDHGGELWKTDGTAEGTEMVLDIYTSGSSGSWPNDFTHFNNDIYFTAWESVHGSELWKTDGTAEGTQMVFDIYSGTASSGAYNFTESNGLLFFSATDEDHGRELWKTDGTAEGTALVKDIYAGPFYYSNPGNLTAFNDELYFTATDAVYATSSNELWKTDGTAEGTMIVKDINTATWIGSSVSGLTEWKGALYFAANDGVNGGELWKTDGTADGTSMVLDIYTSDACGPPCSSWPGGFTPYNNELYFTAQDSVHGSELWKTDGTAEGTELVFDIYSGTGHSSPGRFTVMKGTLYFTAADPDHGTELWKTDGTAEGTELVKDIYTGTASSNINYLTPLNGVLYFSAQDGDSDVELWQSDGTAEGTTRVKDINTEGGSYPWSYITHNIDQEDQFAVIRSGGKKVMVFGANDGIHYTEPWVSDGTAEGTQMIVDIDPNFGYGGD